MDQQYNFKLAKYSSSPLLQAHFFIVKGGRIKGGLLYITVDRTTERRFDFHNPQHKYNE